MVCVVCPLSGLEMTHICHCNLFLQFRYCRLLTQCQNPSLSVCPCNGIPKHIVCCSEGGFLERKTPTAVATTIATIKEKKDPSAPSTLHPVLPPKMIGYMDDDSVTEQSFELPAYGNELLVGGAILCFDSFWKV